jgi:hypothetical protein
MKPEKREEKYSKRKYRKGERDGNDECSVVG